MEDDFGDLTEDLSEQSAGLRPQQTPWLDGLNPEQTQAVTTTDGPLLVLSGAGTGKTRVLTSRLAHIVGLRIAEPWRILAVTFTNRAAREMRERVGAAIGPMAEGVWLGTFHAIGARILRRHAEQVGLARNFTILDTDDQQRALKGLMEERRLDTKKWTPKSVLGTIQRWKDRAWTPAQVPASEVGPLADGQALELYRAYQARLKASNACDFGDLLLHVMTVFQADEAVLQQYRQQFHYIMVDEYQDANIIQYLWLRLLAQKHRNICCVGDDDQSIYSWRGAEVGHILRFERDFPGAQVVRLERNYRSTANILGAASGLIRNNVDRLGKDLRAAAGPQGEKVTVHGVWDGRGEARWVVDRAQSLQRGGGRLSSMAILVRAGFQTREFEERLLATGVPYRMIGGQRFYERLEIRDAMAYVRLIEQPSDDFAFERIINTPKRGLGPSALQVIHQHARSDEQPLLAAARRLITTADLRPAVRKTLGAFLALIDDLAAARGTMTPLEIATGALEQSGYLDFWKNDGKPESPGRVENLQEFLRGLDDYETLGEFIEHVALVMDNDHKAEVQDSIAIMTLHGAKGLEFDTVFLPGWEEDSFPNRRALASDGEKALEEERRLAYVGLTRARNRAYVVHATQRRLFKEWVQCVPSRFISEIPPQFKCETSDIGLISGGPVVGMSAYHHRDGHAQRRDTGWHQPPSRGGRAGGGAIRHGFGCGVHVVHAIFGRGVVAAADSDKLDVDFERDGRKKVMATFVKRVDAV